MWPDPVLNPGSLTCKSGALPTALRGPAIFSQRVKCWPADLTVPGWIPNGGICLLSYKLDSILLTAFHYQPAPSPTPSPNPNAFIILL